MSLPLEWTQTSLPSSSLSMACRHRNSVPHLPISTHNLALPASHLPSCEPPAHAPTTGHTSEVPLFVFSFIPGFGAGSDFRLPSPSPLCGNGHSRASEFIQVSSCLLTSALLTHNPGTTLSCWYWGVWHNCRPHTG